MSPIRRLPSPADCDELRELQSQRVATIRVQRGINQSALSMVKRHAGYHTGLPKPERDKAKRDAAALLKSFAAGVVPVGMDGLHKHWACAAESAKPWDARRDEIERKMEATARRLPAFEWWNSINGLGAMGLAIVVGESGDLNGFAAPGKLWKRLGIAPPDCYLVDRGEGPKRELNRRRRSAIWTVAYSLLKKSNPYRDIYLARKEVERAKLPDGSKMHVHRRASRYAEQRLIKHLWKHWTGK